MNQIRVSKWCCEKAKDEGWTYIKPVNNKWIDIQDSSESYIIEDIKFCPYCGTNLDDFYKVYTK